MRALGPFWAQGPCVAHGRAGGGGGLGSFGTLKAHRHCPADIPQPYGSPTRLDSTEGAMLEARTCSRAASICRSEGRVPNGIFDPWVRWDGGLDSVRNSSAAAVAAVVAAVTHKKTLKFNYPNPFNSDT